MTEDYVLPEDNPSFDGGDCTCDDDPADHGWSGCEAPGCECEASWEE